MVHVSPLWINRKQTFPRLKENINADILVIGGGISGVSAAYHLAHKRKRVVLIEKNLIASGTTGRGTGILEPGFEMDFVDMVKIYGLRLANKFWRTTMKSLQEIKTVIKRHKIACDLENTGSIMFASQEKEIPLLKKDALLRIRNHHSSKLYLHEDVGKIVNANVPAIMFSSIEAIFNQEKFVVGLARHCAKYMQVYEETPALSIYKTQGGYRVKTPHGIISTHAIILTAYASGMKFLKSKHALSHDICYEIATKPLTKEQLRSISWRKGHCIWPLGRSYDYIRLTKDKRLIVGGEDSEIALNKQRSEKHFRRLQNFLIRVFPQLYDIEIDYKWTGTIYLRKRDFPELGQKGNIFYSFAQGGHGLLTGFYGGHLLAHLALGKLDKDFRVLTG